MKLISMHMRTLFFLTSLLLPATVLQAAPALLNLDDQRFLIKDDAGSIAKLSFLGYGKGYQWLGRGKPEVSNITDGKRYAYSKPNDNLQWLLDIKSDNKIVALDACVEGKKNRAIEYLGIELEMVAPEAISYIEFTATNGKTERVKSPVPIGEKTDTKKIAVYDNNNQLKFSLDLKQPAKIHHDKTVRIKLVEDTISAQQKACNQFVLSFNKPGTFYADVKDFPSSSNHSGWFNFTPTSTPNPGELGMAHWLELPNQAMTSKGGQLFVSNKPFKVWGTNVEYAATAPEREEAQKRAAFFAKYGVNGVRLHKLTNPGWEGLGSKQSAAIYDPEKLRKFDYFVSQLRANNITYGLSPIWRLKIFPGDKKRLVAYDEVAKVGTTQGLVWFAKDVQDLHIETMLNLLNHKNPHTGLRYADDPAVTYFEIQNEEDVFFYTTTKNVRSSPTYQKMFAEQFSDWLKAKYGSHDKLVKAWGRAAINGYRNQGELPNEHLDKRNIYPVGTPWMWDNQLKTRKFGARLQDTAEFLLEKQNDYYQRAVQAVRSTGFKGEIVASNWQAGGGSAHILNLMSDAKWGMIDRHNYMGGATGQTNYKLEDGYSLNNATMLPNAGSRILSSGMQQVKDKPFLLSEWLAVPPAEWAAADTTIIAAYGMGLQDWDMSYHFASNGPGFTPTLSYPQEKKFNNLTPVGFGLYPVLSRMVLRGDITPGDVIATRRVTQQQAVSGSYDFESTSEQSRDLKSFDGTPSQKALAVGRVLFEFVDQPKPSTILDWKRYRQGKTISSTTGQLKWTEGSDDASGFIEINSAGTQGFAGFTGRKQFNFNDLTIAAKSDYSVILATAQGQKNSLANDNKIILMAMARTHNTGMNIDQDLIVSAGRGPMILEPVKAEIHFKRQPTRITVLDHDGQKTKQTYTANDGKFQLDTGRDKSPYYLVEF